MKLLRNSLIGGFFLLDLDERDMASIFRRTLDLVVDRGVLPAERRDEVEAGLLDRERQVSTAIGNAVAVPHTYLNALRESVIVFVRLARPINLGAPDGIPTRFVFVLLGPTGATAEHLDSLATIARLMSDNEFRYEARVATTEKDLLAALDHFARRTAPKPTPAASPSAGLTYTGRLGGGLRRDIARRWPQYLSDFRDGLHVKCVGSSLFLYFACLAPAVTFGGVMAVQTEGQIGAVEMLVASACCGVFYALFAGQPLIILGGTGPLLVFTAILYQLCSDLGLPFLPSYAWVGLWSAGFLLMLSVTDAGCLMRYFTRFTDEIFAALISLIFIYEAIKSLVHIFEDLDVKQHHDTALLSLLLALGTFYIATSLSRFRRSSYLLPKIREFLADFGPAIALAAMTGVAVWLHEVFLDVLPAPESFGTTSGRPWSVDLLNTPVWARFAAAGPAVFVTVLVFLDQNITGRIVNTPDHRLHKGEAYHLDLAVVGLLVAFCSLFGLPWLVAATVRSLNHLRSLATTEEVVSSQGETRERVMHVRENRLTGLAIHLLIGLSLLLLPLLKEIPMAVLYGLFLFMGVVSMAGNQFFERMALWLKDPELYPVTHYIRRVPRRTIHAFTALQLACLAVLWFVKSSSIGILFPVFIALLVPVRLLAGRFFAAEHLAALDADEVADEQRSNRAS
ncbi:MAG: PTS sugar transporter subunit IIA [Pirellulaceae bacterium]